MRTGLVVLLLALAAPARAQTECDPAVLATLAAAITTTDVRVPRPPHVAPAECMSVGPPTLELGPPVIGAFAGSCPVVAMIYRWTTIRSETCGYDIYYEPEVVTGVLVVRRHGSAWQRVAIGTPDVYVDALDALGSADLDGDGTVELVVGGRFALIIDERHVRLRTP